MKNGKFRSLDEALQSPEKVLALSLIGKKLEVLPDGVARMRNLKRLLISNCKTEHFPDALWELPELESVEIDVPKAGVPEGLARLPKLRELDCWRA